MRSFFFTALRLSLLHTSFARVPHSSRDLIVREAQPEPESFPILSGLSRWFNYLFRRNLQPRQDDSTCYEDQYYDFVQELGPQFCQLFMDYPDVTMTVDYTPTSTVIVTISTDIHTSQVVSRVIPLTTTTVTVGANGSPMRRNAAAQITERAARHRIVENALHDFRRQNSAALQLTNDASSSSFSSAFSSACDCQDYSGPTVTSTYTDDASLQTLEAFANEYTVVYSTRTAAEVTITQTVTAGTDSSPTTTPESMGFSSPSSGGGTSATGTGSSPSMTTSSGPLPTAAPFTCPEDNDMVVSEMIGNQRFDYLVMCDTTLNDGDLYGDLSYDTFAECAAACALADFNFDYPVCQGVLYMSTDDSNGNNCQLKVSANMTASSPGVDSALLQRVLVGISDSPSDSSSPQATPLSSSIQTDDPGQMSSAVSSIMSNSSSQLSIVTPVPLLNGLLGNNGVVFSTSISYGSTFSSGTAYTSATTYANGSWISYYYTSYTETWATATEVFESTPTGFVLVNSSVSTQSESRDGADGGKIDTFVTNTTTEFPGGYNITEVTSEETFDANGTEIASTATTQVFTFQTGSTNGGTSSGGSASGGSADEVSGGPGDVSASDMTTSSAFSTQTEIINSGGTGGASSFMTGGGPSSTQSVTMSVGGTVYSTEFEASGGPTRTGGGSSTMVSGGALGSFFNSGAPRSGGYESQSSSMTESPPPYSNGGGYTPPPPPPTTSSSSSQSFSNSEGPRSGSESISMTSSLPVLPSSSGIYGGPPPPATSSSSGSFSNSMAPRSGTDSIMSTSTPLPTISTTGVYMPPDSSSSSSGSFSNSEGPRSGSETDSSTSSLPMFPTTGGYHPPPPPETSSSSSESFSNSGMPRSGMDESSTMSATSQTLPTFPSTSGIYGGPTPSSSSSNSFSNSGAPRSGTYSEPSSTSTTLITGYPPPPPSPATSPIPTQTTSTTSNTFSNSMDNRSPYPYSSGVTSCPSMTMGTTTMFTTVTEYGCYSSCAPSWGGGDPGAYGGPVAFGPPVMGG